jgi:hypothetical protein
MPPSQSTLLFLHLPRTGGTTLTRIIERQYAAGRIYKLPYEAGPPLEAFIALPEQLKRQIKVVAGHFKFGFHKHLPQACTYLTLLRDPIERVISTYYYIRSNPTHTHHRATVESNLSLAEFVRRGISVVGTDNGMTRQLSGLTPPAPFGECRHEMVDMARANLDEHFGVAGLTEHYDRSLLLMRRQFGWTIPDYILLNVGSLRKAQPAVDPETLALITNQNRLDLELYEHARTRLNTQWLQSGPLLPLQLILWRLSKLRRRRSPAKS